MTYARDVLFAQGLWPVVRCPASIIIIAPLLPRLQQDVQSIKTKPSRFGVRGFLFAAADNRLCSNGRTDNQMPPMGDTKRSILPSDVPRSDATNEFTPSLALAKARALDKLPRDHNTGQLFGKNNIPRPSDFEFLGLSVYSYVSHLRRTRQFFVLLALLSVSSIIANGYGGQLTEQQLNIVTWLFTGSSLGNASSVAPSYGANEFVISTAMTIFLYFALGTLEEDAHRVEQKQITPADFTVRIPGLALALTLTLTLT